MNNDRLFLSGQLKNKRPVFQVGHFFPQNTCSEKPKML